MTSETNSSSSSSSKPDDWEYEVFLSFRGEDTRNNFTDHLYKRLDEKGISTFRDNEELEMGFKIRPNLLDAIEKSRMAVIVLSKDYASSSWCLDELAQIVGCMEKRKIKMRVWPIFFHVDPSDVRHQRNTFKDAFDKHEERFKNEMEKVEGWRAALREVADLSGKHIKDSRFESKLIQDIVEKIFSELINDRISSDSKGLVGIDSRVEEMKPCLDLESNDVLFVGILGMSGIGKTTLAKNVFRKIQHKFEATSFLSIKAHGLVALQEQLLWDILKLKSNRNKVNKGIGVTGNRLRNKKVLIVLDDVDEDIQLDTLAGNRDWFGPGSRIIVTTKDEHLLERHGVSERDIYGAKRLDNDEALQLFCLKAFHKPHPEENYEDLSNDFVNYAKGLPSTLEVLGKSLFGKEERIWESKLKKLKESPDRDIQHILPFVFDGLGNTDQRLFLDVKCFSKELTSLLSKLYQDDSARCHWFDYIFPQVETPHWFNSQNNGSETRMELPTNLHDNTSWMGLALFASYSLHKPPESAICISFSCLSASDKLPVAPYMASPLSRDVFDGSDRILVFYIPRVLFQSNRCSHIWASFESNNSAVDVKMCGIRLVYKQDVERLVQTLVQCVLRSPEAYHHFYYSKLSDQEKKLRQCDHGKDFGCAFSQQRSPEPMPKFLQRIDNVSEGTSRNSSFVDTSRSPEPTTPSGCTSLLLLIIRMVKSWFHPSNTNWK